MPAPTLIMLAGPNGAGKTTFYRTFLQTRGLPFINADELALRLSLGAYEAAELAESMRYRLLEERISFISETVFSDPAGAKRAFLNHAVEQGYLVTLIFIGLSSVALSRARVKSRVGAGGHDVPEEKLSARYERSLVNLGHALRELPRVIVFDNSPSDAPFAFTAEFQSGTLVRKAKTTLPGWFRRFV
jgi:predicted ABC-type ATPase